MKLSDIASVQSGLVLNRKEAQFPEEEKKRYKRLSLRSLNKYGTVEHKNLENFISKDIIDQTVLTKENDIIVKLVSPIFPTLITSEDTGILIPSQLAVIRVFDNRVMPGYLRCLLASKYISDRMISIEGARIQQVITIRTFYDLDVPVPPPKTQMLIEKAVYANIRTEQLYHRLIEEQNKLTELEIQDIIKRGIK